MSNSNFLPLYMVEDFRSRVAEEDFYNDSEVANRIKDISDYQLQEMIDGYIDWEEIEAIVDSAFDAVISKLEQKYGKTMYDLYNINFTDAPKSFTAGIDSLYNVQIGNIFSDEEPEPFVHNGEVIVAYDLDEHSSSLSLNIDEKWYDSSSSQDFPILNKYLVNWSEFLDDFNSNCENELEEI